MGLLGRVCCTFWGSIWHTCNCAICNPSVFRRWKASVVVILPSLHQMLKLCSVPEWPLDHRQLGLEVCFIYYHAINLSDCQNSLFLMISRSSLYFRDDVIFLIMDQFYFCSVFKPGIHFRGITLRVAIYKSNNSLTFKAHLNLFYSPCYGLKHISIITFVLKKTQNKTNQQQLNRNAKQIIENSQRKQIKTPMCHPSPTL